MKKNIFMLLLTFSLGFNALSAMQTPAQDDVEKFEERVENFHDNQIARRGVKAGCLCLATGIGYIASTLPEDDPSKYCMGILVPVIALAPFINDLLYPQRLPDSP